MLSFNELVLLKDDFDMDKVLLTGSFAFAYSFSLVLNSLLNIGEGGVPARPCFKLPL